MTTKKELLELPSAVIVLSGRPEIETVLVKKIKGNKYEVASIPFFAYNLSFGDLVECHPDEEGIGLFLEKVLKKSGNRTVRVGFVGNKKLDHPEGIKLRQFLKENHLPYEIFKPALIAINMPDNSSYEKLVERFSAIAAIEDAGMQWEDGDPNPRKNLDASSVNE